MLDIKFIRQYPQKVKEGCQKKGVDIDIERLLKIDQERKKYIKDIEFLRSEKNKISEEISKEKNKEKLKELFLKAKKIKEEIENQTKVFKTLDLEFKKILESIPNLPLEEVPQGKDEKDNRIMKVVGKIPTFDFKYKDYLEISQNLDLIDISRASKISGSRFGFLKNEAVILEFALIKFCIETVLKHGFVPIVPPVMIKPKMMWAMGYIKETKSRGEAEEMYFLKDDDLVLVGTSEQSIGPMHANEIFLEKELPKRYIGFSSCFRREAGSYGKDTRGIFRVHQFDKLEMFSFTRPQDSKKEHQFFLEMEETLVKALGLAYRVIEVCSGDMAFPTAQQYDIEVWIPSQNRYRETHSTSNCTDFQARRLNIRFKDQEGKLNFVHTINGTAFAIGRILIAIIENYQRKDGSVLVPKVLQKYTGFKIIKR